MIYFGQVLCLQQKKNRKKFMVLLVDKVQDVMNHDQ